MKHAIPILLLGCGLLAGCGTTGKVIDNTLNKVDNAVTRVSDKLDSAISSKSTTSSVLTETGVKGVKSFTLSNFGSGELSADEKKQLDALAKEIKALGKYDVTIFGHTDNTGSSTVNATVSAGRARAIEEYLKQKGVTNTSSAGKSYNYPVAGNDTAAGRAKNRRVEVFVSTVGKYNPYK